MFEASCEIMISQEILRAFLESTLISMRKLALSAEERRFDQADICLDDSGFHSQGEKDEACRLHDDYMLYRRIQRDMCSLSVSRKRYGGNLDTVNTTEQIATHPNDD